MDRVGPDLADRARGDLVGPDLHLDLDPANPERLGLGRADLHRADPSLDRELDPAGPDRLDLGRCELHLPHWWGMPSSSWVRSKIWREGL